MKLKDLLTVIPFGAEYRVCAGGYSSIAILDYNALNYLPNVQVLNVSLQGDDKEHLTIVLDIEKI